MQEHTLPPTIEELVSLIEEIQHAEWADEPVFFDDDDEQDEQND